MTSPDPLDFGGMRAKLAALEHDHERENEGTACQACGWMYVTLTALLARLEAAEGEVALAAHERDQWKLELADHVRVCGDQLDTLVGERDANYAMFRAERKERRDAQTMHAAVVEQLTTAERERDATRRALEKYGQHVLGCTGSFRPCRCGLDAALRAGR